MNRYEIYNAYLQVSRTRQNKPWRPRKDFTDFDKTEQGILCTRLEFFFARFININIRDFFEAPYILYNDEQFFDLKFYLTQKAISCYTNVQRLKQEELPDSESQVSDIKKSIGFIATKCLKTNVKFREYCREEVNIWEPLIDYKEGNLNLYMLISLPNFDIVLDKLSKHDKEIFLKNIYENIAKFKNRLSNSVKAKKIINNSLIRLNSF